MAIPPARRPLRSGFKNDWRWQGSRPCRWRNSLSVRLLDGGECCLVVELGEAIDLAVNRHVRALGLALERARVNGVLEAVPTYRSLAIYYDPMAIDRDALGQQIGTLYDSLGDQDDQTPRVIEIPTVYGGAYGPDLDFVARHRDRKSTRLNSSHHSISYA